MKKALVTASYFCSDYAEMFFGYGEMSKESQTIYLEDAIRLVSTSDKLASVSTYATEGPNENDVVSLIIPTMVLHNIIMVAEATPAAVEAWIAAEMRRDKNYLTWPS